jgi:predicted transcriptional regulator
MKTTLEFLQEMRETAGADLSSDNKLALFLGITRQAISQYRKGQQMSVAVALKVARALDIDPAEPVFCTLYAQAQSNEEKEFWKEVLDRISHEPT